ncbi:MAG: hypothetical protein GQ564_14790 [Bacteroidales bacterium]|nr:hypothetical protein [Bacteroidales bacterium]
MVSYLDKISDKAVKTEPVRIWLMSCYTGREDMGEYIPSNEENTINKNYANSFTNKLSLLGWINTKIIGFENGVGHSSTLPACREYAAKYKIKTKLKNMGRPGKVRIICENGEINEQYTFN